MKERVVCIEILRAIISESILKITNAKRRGLPLVNHQQRRHIKIASEKDNLCVWYDQKEIVYYELLRPGETVNGHRYRQQLLNLNNALSKRTRNMNGLYYNTTMLLAIVLPSSGTPSKC